MSHTTSINTVRVTNIAAMERAVHALNQRKGLNLRFERGGKVQLWGTQQACDFVVHVPGVQMNLNVGFKGDAAKGYAPVFDSHGGWIAKHIGGGKELAKTTDERNLAHIGGLMHAYAVEAVRDVAATSGAMVNEAFDATTGQTVMQLA